MQKLCVLATSPRTENFHRCGNIMKFMLFLPTQVSSYTDYISLYSLFLLQREKGGQLGRELTSYLVHIIRSNCSDCKLTPSFLRRGLFLCHGNPTRATYRSTLINPSPTSQNATRLVGIIQSWCPRVPPSFWMVYW